MKYGGVEGGGSLTTGFIYYLNSSGNWVGADADAQASADGLLAIALGASPTTNGMLLQGVWHCQLSNATLSSDGEKLYLSTDNPGEPTNVQPTGSADVVRLIGHTIDASEGTIYFNPSNDFIEV